MPVDIIVLLCSSKLWFTKDLSVPALPPIRSRQQELPSVRFSSSAPHPLQFSSSQRRARLSMNIVVYGSYFRYRYIEYLEFVPGDVIVHK
ncbi:4-hydroxybenzoate polyprenyltransferase, mitochondrial, partial [Frankliniella fusca]